jgi:predicted NAD/FAD-binding protein
MLQIVRTIKKLDREGKLHAKMTMGEFIAQVPSIDARFVDEVFYPLLHLAFHATQDEMPNLPVSSFLPTWASAADGASTFYVVEGGVKNYVETVRKSLAATKIKTGADVVALSHTSEGWQVTDASGHSEAYDQVILAIWPNQVAEILKRGMEQSMAIRPHLEATVDTLSRVELAHCRAVIHNDAGLMPPDRNSWPSYSYKNIPYLKTGLSTIWSGQLDQTEVFTSFDWSMDMADLADDKTLTRPRGAIHGVHLHSRTPPRQALYDARAFVQNQQGQHGLWFTGSYLRETCFHEDGLAASLEVLKRLRPDHAKLGRLGKLLSKIPTPWRE